MDPYLSIVIPIFNEEENIPALWERLSRVMTERFADPGKPWEIIFTDDGSRDRSLPMLLDIANAEPRVRVVVFNRNYGQHSAIFGAFAEVKGQVVVTLDADLQNPPEEIPKLVAKIEEGYDVVGGWRQGRQENDSFFRTMPSKLVNAITRRTTGVKLHDYGCMLRAYSREVMDAMLLCKERSSFIPALANSFAKRITEVPVAHAERAAGTSKYGLWKLINLQFDLLTSFSLLPLQMLSVFGVITAVLGFLLFLGLVIYRFMHPEGTAQGVFTLFAILFFFVGCQFIAFGLLGEYIGRIYQEVRDRPRYMVKKVHQAK
ncbi:MAG: glycosyltransferase [Holophagaceae bacterium]|uniref:Glycosyltransferase n=1 Tax=Candidatus Geothrix skivensis TaxID=2954439 RepID=A0A9D7SGY0_9BACT|nr:glycosyltransferase [Candidatus Geothrix skivensis]